MPLTIREATILKTLAQQYAEIAALPAQAERRNRWLKLNRLQMERPMVMIDQVCWNEMDVDGSLKNQVEDPYWQGVESALRQEIYRWRHMPADRVVNPYITLPRPLRNSGFGLAGEWDELQLDRTSDVISKSIHNQIHGFEDLEKIKMPEVTLNAAKEADIVQEARRLFDGIIPFKLTGQCMSLGLWDTISFWMGVEACYTELMDRPELMHALMEKLTQGWISQIEQMNRLGLFDIYSNICHCSHIFSDDLPPATCDWDHPTSHDAWAFGLAQLFTAVSPAITDEFEVTYMQRIFPYFGAIYYGCCDRLDDRLDVIAKLPKIRKISCSPWSDPNRFAANLPKRYIMSAKPTPAYLATDTFDEAIVRADLRRTIAAAKAHDLGLEFLLKDISTVRYDPRRLWRWNEIALEEVER